MKRRHVVMTPSAGLLLMAASGHDKTPWLVWNASPSVPMGLYRVDAEPVQRGELALARLPSGVADFAHRRGYLPKTVLLLKPVVATNGDFVCRLGAWLFVRRTGTVAIRLRDALHRPMPIWRGCRHLRRTEALLLGRASHSFDSRFFGPLHTQDIVGRGTLIWPFALQIRQPT